MKMTPAFPREKFSRLALPPALLLIFTYLMFRNTGLYPVVFGDEWSYSSFARLMPLREAPIPSYLYLWLFGASNACGAAFLDCARGLNSVLFLAAAVPIYAVARRLAPAPAALAVALLAVLGPVNSYTASFMPEASYFLGFWLLSWAALGAAERPGAGAALLCGALLGLMVLVKVHALFLLPGLMLFLLYGAARGAGPAPARLGRGLAHAGLAAAAALATRFGLGYLLAGAPSLSLMGSLYAGQQAYSASLRKPLPQLLQMAAENLGGHAMALALLFGLPLALLLAWLLSPASRRADRAAAPLAVYTLLMLAALLAVTALFTASVAGNGPSETNARLHLRYYDFALPLLSMLAAARLGGAAAPARLRWGVALALAAAMLYACLALPAQFTPSTVDGPELRALSKLPALLYGFTALGAAAVLAWAWRPERGAALFLFGFLPLFTAAGGAVVDHEVRQPRHADAYVLAGLEARARLAPAERAALVVAGADEAGLYKTKFMLDDTAVRLLPVAAGAALPLLALPERGWLLLVGDYAAPPHAGEVARGAQYRLLRLAAPAGGRRLDFAGPLAPALRRSAGLSGAEPWGRWSDGALVELEFAAPLPPRLLLRLKGRAFGPNAGQDVVARVGGAERRLRLAAQEGELAVQFDNAGGETLLTLRVPRPTSPKSLGQGDDGRLLGIGLSGIDLGGANPAPPPPTSAQREK